MKTNKVAPEWFLLDRQKGKKKKTIKKIVNEEVAEDITFKGVEDKKVNKKSN